jgi:hypothetical protein
MFLDGLVYGNMWKSHVGLILIVECDFLCYVYWVG